MTDDLLTMVPNSILLAFQRFPEEAAIIGRLLAGYGDLEYELHLCLGAALGNYEAALRTMFRVRGEKQRVQIADALMRQKFHSSGLGENYCEAIGAMDWCRTCRNQFAHCHWWDEPDTLFFMSLETAAQQNADHRVKFLPIDVPLLEQQEAFFRYTLDTLTYLYREFEVRAGIRASHSFVAPKQKPRPSLHSPWGSRPPPRIAQDSGTPPLEPQKE
jgi:hypothetical protein